MNNYQIFGIFFTLFGVAMTAVGTYKTSSRILN